MEAAHSETYTLSGDPPKLRMLFCTHSNDIL